MKQKFKIKNLEFSDRVKEFFKVFVILAITTWIAHFWHYSSFGLYADDSKFIGIPMGLRRTLELGNLIANTFWHFSQGRPIGFTIVYLSAFFGLKIGGLKAIYWIAYVIIVINACLFYTLLKRLVDFQFFALTGALAFVLFPADNTRAFLTHIHVYPSLTFLLIAFHCYLSDRKTLSYITIVGSLLSYETVFPIFLTAPLLKKKWDATVIKALVKHISIVVALVIGAIVIRKIAGESRISNLELLSTIHHAIANILFGPFVSLSRFFAAPLETLSSLNIEIIIFGLLSFVGFVWIFSRSKSRNLVAGNASHLEISKQFKQLIKLSLVGLAMLVLAYPLTLTLPVTRITGTGSRVHLAAVFGASILLGCLCTSISLLANSYQKKHLASGILAVFFALLVGFGLLVQRDYQLSWQYQRAFWTDIVRLCPDIDEGNIILVERKILREPKYMKAFNVLWSTPVFFRQIYQFPKNWKNLPSTYLLPKDWPEQIKINNNLFEFKETIVVPGAPQIHQPVASSNIIFLEEKNGKLRRRTEPLILNNRAFSLKRQPTVESPSLKQGHLYKYLIMTSNETPIYYLQGKN